MFKKFTRGGQVTLHNLRMIRQVLAVTLGVTVVSGFLTFGLRSWFHYTPYERSALMAYYWADVKLGLPLVNTGSRRKLTQNYTYPNGEKAIVFSMDIVKDRWHQQLAANFKAHLFASSLFAFWMMGLVFICTCGGWMWRGHVKHKKKVLSGMEIVPAKQLTKLVQKEGSLITMGGIPLRKNSETQHFLICGTTGTGKSTCFFELLPQVRALKQRAVIVDTTGEFVSRYYRQGKDILINPFDERTMGWNPWIDCTAPYHYDEVASAFIPQTGSDKFWSDAARTVFAECLKLHAYIDDIHVESMLHKLLTVPLRDLFNHLATTPAASLVDPAGDRTAMSIRAHLASYLKPLVYLDDTRPAFSIRQWVLNDEANDDQWIFIAGTPDQRETLRPFMTALIGSAINALMGSFPDRDRRLWFIIDELSSLHKQEALPKALSEIRKYGGCIAVGLQDIPQLQASYGRYEAESLVSLLNTKVIFRNGHPDTAQVMSKMLGEQEVRESMESISYGAHQMRDGVNLNEQQKMKPVVTPTDLMSLEDRQAYIKLPGNLPIAKIKFPIPVQEIICPPFVSRTNDSSSLKKEIKVLQKEAEFSEVQLNIRQEESVSG